MNDLIDLNNCPCGKAHEPMSCSVTVGKGVLAQLPEIVKRFGAKKPFVFFDVNTYKAAGRTVCKILRAAEMEHASYCFEDAHLEPDEKAVGSVFMHFDVSCDIIIGVGSGVINDIGKIVSVSTNKKYIIVATAPSMDGYASNSSSMIRGGLKTSLFTKYADAVVGDIDVLKNAPLDMLKAGIGDMLAKYISIGEWKIGRIVLGEYYCERVAQLVKSGLKHCVENASGLIDRNDEAVEAVFRGLVEVGFAMSYAGVTRPASGVDHYFSHIWDMRGVEFGTPVSLHGLQCGVGTLYSAKVYDKIRTVVPNKEKALAHFLTYNIEENWSKLHRLVGRGAEGMIAAEARDKKYDQEKHSARLENIINHWDEIVDIINTEIPTADYIEGLLDLVGAPKSCEDFGISGDNLSEVFAATKDVKFKYVASHLCFDLGILKELGNDIFKKL